MASPPTHQIWGDAEVLSCYSSSDESSLPRTGPRKFPCNIKRHMEKDVKFSPNDQPHSGSKSQSDNPTALSSRSADEVQPSSGSEHHASLNCKPCLYMNRKTGCINGMDCAFCHYPHPKRSRPRPSKSTRLQCKQIASMLDPSATYSQQLLEAKERLGMDSLYMEIVLKGRRREREQAAAGGGGGGIEGTAAEAPAGAPATQPAKVPANLLDPEREQ